MPRQEGDLAAFKVSDHVCIGRFAERRVKRLLVGICQPGHGIQTAAPDDPYLRLLLHAGSAWKTEPVIIQNRVERLFGRDAGLVPYRVRYFLDGCVIKALEHEYLITSCFD